MGKIIHIEKQKTKKDKNKYTMIVNKIHYLIYHLNDGTQKSSDVIRALDFALYLLHENKPPKSSLRK